MTDSDRFALLAEYNAWMNTRLYAACADLSDAERKKDRGAFFKSIHGTLNHLMWADKAFMSRLTGDAAEIPPLGTELYADFDEMRRDRAKLDDRIQRWAAGLEQDWLDAEFGFLSKIDGKTRRLPTWAVVTQMFNHQAHHRGQITTLLSQLGIDIGTTDIPFMPRFQPD